MSDRIVVVPYDHDWPARYARERGRLLPLFEPGRVRIEHVGSTAVPGLDAKPIVDVLLGVAALAEIEARIPALEALGWQYVPEHEDVFPARRFLALPASRPHSHHLHAVEIGTDFFRDHLAFRDHLRSHAVDAAAYAELKRRLAERFRDDRPGYTDAKTAFIESVLARCR